jgi:rhodanese-related sulfurtransferase/rubrerythrin
MMQEFQDISVERLRAYLAQHEEQDYVLIDVRQPEEYTKGHIPGALLIPLGELPERMGELPTDKDIILYCRSGKRSRGAAILVGSQPQVAGTVFNMSGGILAWNGEVLPAAPQLKVFGLSGGDHEILLRAMELERGAGLFYTTLSQRYDTAPWAEVLSKLAGAEEAHARMIYRFWSEGQADPPAFALVYAGLKGDIVEGGVAMSSLLTMLADEPSAPCRATLEMALSIEYAAYDLSRNMAHRWRGQPLEPVFLAIAEAEKDHMRLVSRALGLCQGQ